MEHLLTQIKKQVSSYLLFVTPANAGPTERGLQKNWYNHQKSQRIAPYMQGTTCTPDNSLHRRDHPR
jgi:hypothetical protein